MENHDNGRTYIITGNWDPEREDTLVLNTETKKGEVLNCVLVNSFDRKETCSQFTFKRSFLFTSISSQHLS